MEISVVLVNEVKLVQVERNLEKEVVVSLSPKLLLASPGGTSRHLALTRKLLRFPPAS